jgi:hypothetical protein
LDILHWGLAVLPCLILGGFRNQLRQLGDVRRDPSRLTRWKGNFPASQISMCPLSIAADF